MTVIAAIHDSETNQTVIGSNSRATLGNLVSPSIDKKWLSIEGWLIGVTGSGPKLETLQACAGRFPKNAKHPIDVLKFMKSAYDEFDIGEVDEGLKRYCGGGLIVHKTGSVWDFDNSLCITEVPLTAFWARGSGMDMAIGAALALRQYVNSPREIMQRVLQIVVENDVECPGEPLVQIFTRDGVIEAAP